MALLLAAILAVGCDTATITQPPGSPGASDTVPPTSGPGETAPPGSGAIGTPAAPDGAERVIPAVPRPTLTDPGEIGVALYDPGRMGDAVVSLLALMGVGIYAEDGSVVQEGNQRGAGDPWLYEAEVWELVEMGVTDLLEAPDDGDLEYGLADLHEALAGSLPGTSSADFIAAYESTYAAHPDHLAPSVLLGQPIDASTRFTRTQLWLLFMDGFVDLADPVSARPGSGARFAQAAGAPPFGTANPSLQSLASPQTLSADQWAELLTHFLTIAGTFPFRLDAGFAHEGHGGQGTPIEIRAIVSQARPFRSPLTGAILLQPFLGPRDGLRITWTSEDVAVYADHGTLASSIPGQGVTDAAGVAMIKYTPKREVANNTGFVAEDTATMKATARLVDLAQRAYRMDDPAILAFLTAGRIRGTRTIQDFTGIRWHTPGIEIKIVNTYDITVGSETGGLVARMYRAGHEEFTGTLTRTGNNTYEGTMTAMSDAYAEMEFIAGVIGDLCQEQVKDAQVLDVVGRIQPAAVDPGLDVLSSGAFGAQDLILSFYPATEPADPGRCTGTIPYQGNGPNGRPMTGNYMFLNDTRLTSPSIGYRIHLPTSGQLVYEDWRFLDENLVGDGVDSLFEITVNRSEGA